MICRFWNWIKSLFLKIYQAIKNFFTRKKNSEPEQNFIDLEAGTLKRQDTMDTQATNEDGVRPFSDSDEENVLDVTKDESETYGMSPSDLSKNAWSSDQEDPIDEEGLVNEFTEKCAIDANKEETESYEVSDIDVSDEVGSEPENYEHDEVEDTEVPEPLLDLSETTETTPGSYKVCPVTGEISSAGEGTCPVTDDLTPESQLDDSEIVQVEGVDIENIEMALASSEEDGLEIPKAEEDSDVEKTKKSQKILTRKLNWEAKASIPKYAMTINSKLNKEDIQKASITTRGKAEKIAKAKTELNQSKAKIVKDQFKRDIEDKRTADQIARARIVEKERTRVAEAKLKKELAIEKLRKEASERYRKEKEEKEKEKLDLETKRREFNRAKVEAIRTSKNEKF